MRAGNFARAWTRANARVSGLGLKIYLTDYNISINETQQTEDKFLQQFQSKSKSDHSLQSTPFFNKNNFIRTRA